MLRKGSSFFSALISSAALGIIAAINLDRGGTLPRSSHGPGARTASISILKSPGTWLEGLSSRSRAKIWKTKGTNSVGDLLDKDSRGSFQECRLTRDILVEDGDEGRP